MKIQNKVITLTLLLFTGCTVISYDRVFPKLAFAWSSEAQEQRREQRQENAHKSATKSVYSEETPLALKCKARDGTNYIGVYMGMIAEWDGWTSRYHPPTNYIGGVTGLEFADQGWMETNAIPQGVMMFSATSGELLKWISAEDFTNIFVLKIKPEYP